MHMQLCVSTRKPQVVCWLLFHRTDNSSCSTLGGGTLAVSKPVLLASLLSEHGATHATLGAHFAMGR
jgi:hypothetical protein